MPRGVWLIVCFILYQFEHLSAVVVLCLYYFILFYGPVWFNFEIIMFKLVCTFMLLLLLVQNASCDAGMLNSFIGGAGLIFGVRPLCHLAK